MSISSATETAQKIHLLLAAESVVATAIQLFCPDRTGGYFCVACAHTSIPFFVVKIGEVNDECKAEKYCRFCQEKARRLAFMRTHDTSMQSRNEEMERFGGAIRCRNLIFSFSGLPERVDEAVMLVTAILTNHLTLSEANIMAMASENPYFAPLCIKANVLLVEIGDATPQPRRMR